MNLFRGSWNATDDEIPIHSPVRLLQKLAAFRASTGSTPVSSSTSPSPQNERKSTILSESTNFFTRLWRPHIHQETPSQILLASHEINSSSFDHIPEPTPTLTEVSSIPSSSLRSNNRISFIRDVSSKNPTQSCQFSSPLVQPPVPFQPQPTTSSIITDPSFEDTTSEQPYDTASEFYSQSFETNIDGSNPKIVDEENSEQQQGLTYDERHRRLSLSAKSVIQSVQKISSLPLQMTEQHHSNSLNSPEANIDVSMAMDYFSTPIITTPSVTEDFSLPNNNNNNNNNNQERTNHADVRNSDTWARKRTLMHRDYQWTTTLDDVESIANNNDNNNNRYNSIHNPTVLSNLTTNSLTYTGQKNSSSSSKKTNTKSDSSNVVLRRRHSSRRLPEIPLNCKISSNDDETNRIEEIEFPLPSSSSLYTTHEQPSQLIHENSPCNRSTCSKSTDSDSSLASRLVHTKLLHTHQSQNTKSVDLSNLTRRKSFLIVNNTLLPQRSLDYPCIVRKAPDLSDIVRQRMLYAKISKQQGENFSLSLEREHVPKVPRKIIIRQDNSIEIALSKPPKLRRQTLSEEFCYGCNPDIEFTSISPMTNASSTLGLPIPSSGSGLLAGDRRKTIETCENIYLHAEESSKLRARTPPSNPHRILLHRDKNDTSIRTNGLGMRIVGGQECEDGSLGCFVTNILYGGPADVQGNIEVGDQILEFNGHSLIESTYEEVRILQDHCGDIVQLVVQHNNVRLQINNGQTLSSIEISRHFETVPRLSSSLTRKRRNLPPLPPSLSSTIPKQQKKELYETVETLEVPNVKELKPILINRGRLLAQIWHDVDDLKLALTIIQASNLPLRSNGDQPYAFITGKMLFEDRGFDMFETKIIHSSNPVYNETFVFHEVESVDVLHLEILLWDKKQYQTNNDSIDESDEFLGMIQLPLNEANLEDEPRWYELRDRQTRKPSATSVTFKSSSIESADSGRKMPPLLLSNKHDEKTKTTTDASMHTVNPSVTNTIDFNRRSSSTQTASKHANITGSAIPTIIMTDIDDDKDSEDGHRRQSAIAIRSAKLKRRISKGISKLFDGHTRRFSESTPDSPKSPASRKLSSQIQTNIDKDHHIDISVGLTLDNTSTNINKSPRQSVISTINQDEQQTLIRPIPLQQMPIGQLMLPYIPSSRHSSISGSRKSSATSNFDSDDDIDRYFTLSEQQQEQINDNSNVQTHTVGPGQVTPRNYENMIHDYINMGKIQLGLIVTKGLLEIDIISAKGLERIIDESGDNNNNNNGVKIEDTPPDTYVKTYLRTGTRRVQKRKTAIIKGSYNPEYHSKLKYNACNVMGRRLQVTVWQRGGKFEKNQCIGEAFIQLDNLTLNQHTIAWYILFREKLVESEFYDSTLVSAGSSLSYVAKRVSNNAAVKRKHTKPNASKITNNNQVAKVSRKHLIDSLAEIGILIPTGIKTDVLRPLYETNIIEEQKKKKNKLTIASAMAKAHHNQHAASADDSSDDNTHQIDDININYNKMTPADTQDEEGDLIIAPQPKISNEFSHQAEITNNINNNSGKPFISFSASTAEENLHFGSNGPSVRGNSDLETVPNGLRKAIIEGYNVNLVRLLLLRDNKKYNRNDDVDEDKNVYLKQKDDHRLHKNLTILEFILAFTHYLNIIDEVFPQRRRELTAYMRDIICLSSRFGHPFFLSLPPFICSKS
ncbi:unnamed protein product [Rotaria sp. Silwood1]|nr:unnamed protein product [Rotaria sp. Silwood1]